MRVYIHCVRLQAIPFLSICVFSVLPMILFLPKNFFLLLHIIIRSQGELSNAGIYAGDVA